MKQRNSLGESNGHYLWQLSGTYVMSSTWHTSCHRYVMRHVIDVHLSLQQPQSAWQLTWKKSPSFRLVPLGGAAGLFLPHHKEGNSSVRELADSGLHTASCSIDHAATQTRAGRSCSMWDGVSDAARMPTDRPPTRDHARHSSVNCNDFTNYECAKNNRILLMVLIGANIDNLNELFRKIDRQRTSSRSNGTLCARCLRQVTALFLADCGELFTLCTFKNDLITYSRFDWIPFIRESLLCRVHIP